MRHHPIFDELDASLAPLIAAKRVEFSGQWLSAARRTYEGAPQLGTGSGPFEDVVDWRWRGVLTGAAPIAGVVFLVTTGKCFWSKSAPPTSLLEVGVSFHAYSGYSQRHATFTASVGGAVLPGVPVVTENDPKSIVTFGTSDLRTARVETIAHTAEATIAVVLLPADALKTGRNHLWRVRDRLASTLPPRTQEILTRRRSGSIG